MTVKVWLGIKLLRWNLTLGKIMVWVKIISSLRLGDLRFWLCLKEMLTAVGKRKRTAVSRVKVWHFVTITTAHYCTSAWKTRVIIPTAARELCHLNIYVQVCLFGGFAEMTNAVISLKRRVLPIHVHHFIMFIIFLCQPRRVKRCRYSFIFDRVVNDF